MAVRQRLYHDAMRASSSCGQHGHAVDQLTQMCICAALNVPKLASQADSSTNFPPTGACHAGHARFQRESKPSIADHVPDLEEERERIEAQNPNPKLPLVRYVGETWRVGGLLALSRAFGDAYMKGSLQFEGIAAGGSDGYSAGFGVIAEPSVETVELTPQDSWVRSAAAHCMCGECSARAPSACWYARRRMRKASRASQVIKLMRQITTRPVMSETQQRAQAT